MPPPQQNIQNCAESKLLVPESELTEDAKQTLKQLETMLDNNEQAKLEDLIFDVDTDDDLSR